MGIATGCSNAMYAHVFYQIISSPNNGNSEGGERKSIRTLTVTHSFTRCTKHEARYRKMILSAINWLFASLRHTHTHYAERTEHTSFEMERRVILISVCTRTSNTEMKQTKRMKWIKCQKYCQNNISQGDGCKDGWLDGFHSTENEFNCGFSSVNWYHCTVPLLPQHTTLGHKDDLSKQQQQ